MEPFTREKMMAQLDFFIGTWKVEVTHPHLRPAVILGEARFEWMEGNYIVQRTHIDKPEFPRSTIVYDWEEGKARYVQHYFDSRGVTRLYQMSFEEGIWKLWRNVPDFSPLDFHQHFNGIVDKAGNAIEGSWEQSQGGVEWEHDFKLIYRRKQ